MMTVVGEEGVTLSDYVVFLKGDWLDMVYLQQNSFDEVDAFASRERQRHVFGLMLTILEAALSFQDKPSARSFFNNLRQRFIDWNYMEFQSDAFNEQENGIRELLEPLIPEIANQEG
jgi:V/A-type H+-transporting ATPase subunit A